MAREQEVETFTNKYVVFKREIRWVLEYYGTPGADKEDRIRDQVGRIVEFIRQYDEAQALLVQHKLNLVKVTC